MGKVCLTEKLQHTTNSCGKMKDRRIEININRFERSKKEKLWD